MNWLLAHAVNLAFQPAAGPAAVGPDPVDAEPVEDRQPGDDVPTEVVAPVAEPEPEPLTAAPAKAPPPKATPAASTAPSKKAEEPASPLLPKKELEIVADVPVDPEKTKFRAGKGLSFQTKDKRFALQMRLRAQLLYSIENDADARTTEHGLQLRRARVAFGGNFFGEHNKFKMELAVSPRDMGFRDGAAHQTPVLDWYFEFDQLESLTLRAGQYKVPYSRQRVISSADLQLVDRAIANGEFNLDRDVGLDLRSKDFLGKGKLRYYAGVFMGEGRDPFENGDFKLFYLGRVEYLPLGMFEDYSESDFDRSLRPKLAFGAAYGYVDNAKRNRSILGNTPSDGGTTDYHNATADVVFKMAGFSFTGEFFFREGRRNFGDATEVDDAGNEVPAPREGSRDGVGWFAQAGFLIPRLPLEFAARYGELRRIGSGSSLPVENELGGGVNWYFARHPLKLQLDYFHLWPDHQLKPGTNQIRLQLQAGF